MARRIMILGGCFILATACGGDDLKAYDCSVFPPVEKSPYVLPWTVGQTYTAYPHAARETGPKMYAVDVQMPIGTPLLAVADGIVRAVGEAYLDTDHTPGHENFVIVEHADGTVAGYGHLTYMGAVVEPDNVVKQGDLIGYSGNTGNSTGPHLHFDVLVNCDVSPPVDLDVVNGCANTPLSFKNAMPATSCGLQYGVAYTAAP